MLNHLQDNGTGMLPGIQLQFLRYLLMGQSPNKLLDGITATDMLHIYDFIWEKALEIGIRVKGERFSQSDMLKHLKSVEQYKLEVGCKEPLQRCITNDCVLQNEDCVRAKLKDQLNRLYRLISSYLKIEYRM
ncbi:hypothetical protein EH223_19940 [candidate division KSB1 bacterium]|nr:hypothetical protein [candidate division KSB1 bacterium]RQW00211.1 MAG: hypothetical protein EH223_19940 [candidate division KSB1 bacterium]